jgi:hypothetical protein
MAINTLKGLKRQAIRTDLAKQGYRVYNHHYSRNDIDRLLHIAMNRLAEQTGDDFYQLFMKVCVELNRVKSHVRVERSDWKDNEKDLRVVCLEHTELNQSLNNSTNHTPDK